MTPISFQNSTPNVESTYPGTAAVIREAFEKQSLSNDIIEALISSLSVNSLKQYNCAYKKWWQYCKQKDIDHYSNNIPQILKIFFFSSQLKAGAGY